MAKKFPDQRMFFASWQRPRDIRDLSALLVSMLKFPGGRCYGSSSSSAYLLNLLFVDVAKQHPHAMELNVLVIGMPNVGKSTLLNALRNMGIKGRTSD
jgi:ribosome biogenesis GTPase A